MTFYFVCLSVSASLPLVHTGQPLCCADLIALSYNNSIPHTLKGTTSKLLRCRKKVDVIHIYFCEATDSMQYRPPNANQDVSKTNHFGSVSDSLRRMVHFLEYPNCYGRLSTIQFWWVGELRVRTCVMDKVRAWVRVAVRVMVGVTVSMVLRSG